jgi:hypothetical protein
MGRTYQSVQDRGPRAWRRSNLPGMSSISLTVAMNTSDFTGFVRKRTAPDSSGCGSSWGRIAVPEMYRIRIPGRRLDTLLRGLATRR